MSTRCPTKITARRGSPPAESATTSSSSSSDPSTRGGFTTESSSTGGPPWEEYYRGYFDHPHKSCLALVLNFPCLYHPFLSSQLFSLTSSNLLYDHICLWWKDRTTRASAHLSILKSAHLNIFTIRVRLVGLRPGAACCTNFRHWCPIIYL